jgi:hypothetical protein
MLLVFPVSQPDADLALKLAEWISELGNVAAHECLVVSPPNTAQIAERIASVLRPHFKMVHLFATEKNHDIGWPSSPNYMFLSACNYLVQKNNQQPWFWFEADNTPLHENWLNDVVTEYNLSGKPYLGVVEFGRMKDPKTGEMVKSDVPHMNGSGVYHPKCAVRSAVFQTIHTFKEAVPFDMYIRYELNGNVHDSKTIFNNWKTRAYTRLPDGSLACKALDANYPPKEVPPGVGVIHGCKDGSLIELLKRERSTPKAISKKQKPTEDNE